MKYIALFNKETGKKICVVHKDDDFHGIVDSQYNEKELTKEQYGNQQCVNMVDGKIVLDETKINFKRKNEIYSRLSEIDIESLRSLRAIANGTEVNYDTEKIKTLETEAYELRTELSEL